MQSGLRRGIDNRDRTVTTEYVVEKDIFIGFYAVRKLIENNYISSKLVGKNYAVMAYPYSPNQTANPKHFLHNYNLFKGSQTPLSIKNVCDQFVHSYHFSPFTPLSREMVGVYFCSDREQSKNVFYLQLVKIVEGLYPVSNNSYTPLKLKVKNGKCFTNIAAT